MSHDLYRSYLIRFWRESISHDPEVCWRGEVESVQTGQKWQFSDLRDMLRFIQKKVELPSSNNPDKSGGVR
jgi:hypothetical protein